MDTKNEVILKQFIFNHGQTRGGSIVGFTDDGFLAMEALGAVIEESKVADELLKKRYELLKEIPPCAQHGDQCVEHAIEWVKEQKKRFEYGGITPPAPAKKQNLIIMGSDVLYNVLHEIFYHIFYPVYSIIISVYRGICDAFDDAKVVDDE